jgi:hypothetical protein
MTQHSPDLGFGKTEIFLQMGLDRENRRGRTDLPVGQISGSVVVPLPAIDPAGRARQVLAMRFEIPPALKP